jgi:glycerol kinase
VQGLAESVPDSGGVMFVPAFTGLGAPYWQPDARGAIVGLTRGSTVAHIARAALESIAFQSAALLQAMSRDASGRWRANR